MILKTECQDGLTASVLVPQLFHHSVICSYSICPTKVLDSVYCYVCYISESDSCCTEFFYFSEDCSTISDFQNFTDATMIYFYFRNSSGTAPSHRLSYILSHTLIINRIIYVLWSTLYMAASEPSHIEGKYGWSLSHLVNMSNSKQSDNMITVGDISLGLIQLSNTGSPCVTIGKCSWKYIHILKFHNTNLNLPLIPMLEVQMNSYRIFFHPQM